MHTTWTDGRCTVLDYVNMASRLGLQAIALTEHVGFKSPWYAQFCSEVEAVQRTRQEVEVYRGIEVAAWDYRGRLKASNSLLRRADLIIGVVHRYPSPAGGPQEFSSLNWSEALACELKALMALAQNPTIHILGHPGGTFFKRYGPFDVNLLRPVFQAAKRADIAVELSARYTWDWPNLLALLWDVSPLLSIASDAHDTTELGHTHRALRLPLQSFRNVRSLQECDALSAPR
jgi:putative hydrolase